MSIMAPITLLTIPYHVLLLKISSLLITREFFLALVGPGSGGCHKYLASKPFETVMVIMGYTNKFEWNYRLLVLGTWFY